MWDDGDLCEVQEGVRRVALSLAVVLLKLLRSNLYALLLGHPLVIPRVGLLVLAL